MTALLSPSVATDATSAKHILYVDDDAGVREMVQRLLGRYGYEVDTAADGEDAWNALHHKEYQLLITDQNMPRRTGAELILQIRRDGMGLPIVITSEAVGTSPLNEARPHVAAVLPKPFAASELLEAVKKVLEQTAEMGPAETAMRSIVRNFTSNTSAHRNWGINE